MKEFLRAVTDATTLRAISRQEADFFKEACSINKAIHHSSVEKLIRVSEVAHTFGDAPYNFKPKSNYGRLLNMLATLKSARGTTKLQCCLDAEPILLSALHIQPPLPYNQTEADYAAEFSSATKGPLVCIVSNGKTIAVQKNIGEPSIYALRTDEKLGLIDRSFSGSTNRIKPTHFKTKSPIIKVDAACYGAFYPIRLSTSVFSHETKKAVGHYYDDNPLGHCAFVAFDHIAIIEAVNTAMQQAVEMSAVQ